MNDLSLDALAERLRTAQSSGEPCAPLTQDVPDLSVEDAYAIQRTNIEARLQKGLFGKPTQIVGRKIGITSEAIQSWLNVSEPDFGTLLSDMMVLDGALVDTSYLVQPRCETEVAFVMDCDLAGPGVTPADVLRSTAYLLPAIEIIDSRIADWKIKYHDTIADNASSGMFVVGNDPIKPERVELRLAGMAMRKNGAIVSTGAGAACLGHPVNAVVWLANKLGEMDESIHAGDIVLSGALGPVTEVAAGDVVSADINGLGSVRVRFG